MLGHEREHGAARDPWLLLGAAVAVALEVDCDARELAAGADPARCGQLLLFFAQRSGAIPLAPMLAAVPSPLERRIIAMHTRLTDPSLRRRDFPEC